MTNPEHSTCPRWAAQEARRIALEQAAALCEAYACRQQLNSWIVPQVARELRDAIRALIEAGK